MGFPWDVLRATPLGHSSENPYSPSLRWQVHYIHAIQARESMGFPWDVPRKTHTLPRSNGMYTIYTPAKCGSVYVYTPAKYGSVYVYTPCQ